MKKVIRLTESDLIHLVKKVINEGLPPSMTKLFGAQTSKRLEQFFEPAAAQNIEKYFAHIISSQQKNLLTKSGQQYLKSSLGVEIPALTLKSILDLGMSGKINKSNMEQYLALLPEKLFNGSELRNNIRALLTPVINKVEKGGVQKGLPQTQAKSVASSANPATSVNQIVSKGSYNMADSDESFKLAKWFDQKFYESGYKRHEQITKDMFDKMLPETKDYLKKLYERMKQLDPYNPNSRITPKTDFEIVQAATNNYWGGLGRYGKLTSLGIYGEKVPSLPIPSKSIENNLNTLFPTNPSGLNKGQTAWSSSK
jgi:hypothetical protein